jgi:T5SS/PEP-CTERM-associated repeat protein
MKAPRLGLLGLGMLATAVTLALIGLHSPTALAATRSWDGGGGADTDWTTGANWDVFNTVPAASDTAQFDRGAAFNYTVTFPTLIPGGDIRTDRLIVGSNAVTFEPDHSNTGYLLNGAFDELGRGIIIGEEANDTAAALTSHLGLLSTAAATLGHVAAASGSLTLNQNNDQFNVWGFGGNTELIIGRYGTGVLNVSAGADVNVSGNDAMIGTGNVSLGHYSGSHGTGNIDGTGSTWNIAGSLVVGNHGNGALNITNGGQVINDEGSVGDEIGSTGTAVVSGAGSKWTNTGFLTVADGGILSVSDDGAVEANGIDVFGEINGNGTIVSDVYNGGGVLSPSGLQILGNYQQGPGGVYSVKLGPNGHGTLFAGGTVSLGGFLQVELNDGFTFNGEQTYLIINRNGGAGFQAHNLPSVPGIIFDVVYNPQSVVLTVLPAFTADFDEDGDVDGDDLLQWQGDFGPSALSDADNDGDSDGADFLAWQQQLGSPSLQAETTAVPEPMSGAMLLAGILALAAATRPPRT